LGTIAAGIPLLADQNIEDHFIVDSRLNADYIIKIKGNSMIEEGILDGDFAFIKIQHQVENGEIAAVLIEDSATLKKVYRQNGTITLVSANKDIPPKVFTNGDIRIMGKLVAVLNVR
jgi:repressor LexA